MRVQFLSVLVLISLSGLLFGCSDKDADTDSEADADADADADTDADTDADVDTDTDTDADTDTTALVEYTIIGSELPNAVMSIWMSDSTDVWLVGADASGDPAGPFVAHYDGTGWTDHDVDMVGKLQWVWSDGGDNVVMVGASAQVVWHSISAGTWDVSRIGDGRHTLWGVWGSSADDIWAVAGDGFGYVNAAIYHFDGTSWAKAWDAPADKNYLAYKVWGNAADDVWVVGSSGLLVHWDGATWTKVTAPQGEGTMFTVHGVATDDLTAVGGFANAVIWNYDGTSWKNDSPPLQAIAPKMTGVYVHDVWGTVACGNGGALWWRGADEWAVDALIPATAWNYHACWIDPNGGVWAVGGNIDSPSLDHGVVAYKGTETIAPL